MSSIREFYSKDHILRASFPGQPFLCLLIKADKLVEKSRTAHKTNPLETILLGDMLMAAALTAATLKGQQRVQFSLKQTDVQNPYQIVTEADATGEVRGYCNNLSVDDSAYTRNEMIRFALGKGKLAVTNWLHPEKPPVISQLDYCDETPAEILSQYFLRSVQTPTACMLNVKLNDDFTTRSAYGYLIQALPGSDEQLRVQLEQHLASLPSISDIAASTNTTEEVFMQLLEPIGEAVFHRQSVHFFCRCSMERFERSIALLPVADIESMADDGTQTLKCHYCSAEYLITPDRLRSLIQNQ